MDTAPVCLKPYSVIHRCPRATPTGRWLKSEGPFCYTFKPRACLGRRSCATPASCFWSLACWSEKDAIRLRATKSPVAPSAGRKVNGGEAGPEPSSGRRSVSAKWPVPGAHSWAGSKTSRPPQAPYPFQRAAWASFLHSEGLSESTVRSYGWWINGFLQWLKQEEVPLRQVTATVVDGFMRHLSSRRLNRVSLATAAKILRRFSRYAYEQGWWRRDWAPVILAPRLFRQEDLPLGPAWTDVRRLIAASDGDTRLHLRNRAILLLLSVYGLRSGEVRGLRLEDLDWTRRILRVRRSKTARVQEQPLTTATGKAIQRYLKKARPECARKELFLTLHAPFRRLSAGALYHLTSSLLQCLDIASPKRGPHALRHASATYLLNSGSSLKTVGDHLGHRSLGTTRIYAKVDLAGLRAVAAFDLGGLL